MNNEKHPWSWTRICIDIYPSHVAELFLGVTGSVRAFFLNFSVDSFNNS